MNFQKLYQLFARNNVNTKADSISNSGWKHVELGAANYGLNINADCSYQVNTTNSALQFKLLFQTLDTFQ